MIDVKNKWALITGASRGIGREVSLFMAKQACNLILHSRSIEALETVDKEAKALGVQTLKIACELSDLKAVDSLLDQLDQLDLTIDYVFNNAGIQIAYRTDYYATPDQDFTESFLINTIAPMKICYHFLPKMIENKFGRIINTTSGITGEPEQAGYSASKAALDKVTKDLAGKLNKTGVTINLVDPGWCRTDLGGQYAPNSPDTTIPGVVLPAFAPDTVNGQIIPAQAYKNLTLEEALHKILQ